MNLIVQNKIDLREPRWRAVFEKYGTLDLYEKIKRAKGVKDLCEALGMEYTEKLSDAPSRGEKSIAAKAADRIRLHIHV